MPFCKRCGAENFYRAGKSKDLKQRYQCRKCKHRFVWTSDLPKRHFFSNVLAFAVELYAKAGISLRTVAKTLRKYFDLIVSHECIRKWVLSAEKTNLIDDNRIPTKTWHADETYIKIKGTGYWLWIVYCKESKHIIAWHISKGRFFKDAKTLLQKAMHATQNTRPKKIITDGLFQYQAAIKKIIGWNWREQKKRHIIDSGIGKNALIERLNREIKRRIKWFSTFQSIKGANAFFKVWFYHHNTLKLT